MVVRRDLVLRPPCVIFGERVQNRKARGESFATLSRRYTGQCMILFGVRSPLVVDFEETLRRLERRIEAAVSVNGVPRLLDRGALVDLANFTAKRGEEFIIPAFAPVRRRDLWNQAVGLGLEPCRF